MRTCLIIIIVILNEFQNLPFAFFCLQDIHRYHFIEIPLIQISLLWWLKVTKAFNFALSEINLYTFAAKSNKSIGERKTRSPCSSGFFLWSTSNSFSPQTLWSSLKSSFYFNFSFLCPRIIHFSLLNPRCKLHTPFLLVDMMNNFPKSLILNGLSRWISQ